jgi:hypothetical protein
VYRVMVLDTRGWHLYLTVYSPLEADAIRRDLLATGWAGAQVEEVRR